MFTSVVGFLDNRMAGIRIKLFRVPGNLSVTLEVQTRDYFVNDW